MTSVALVLGAGGVIGGAYHAGALAAIAEATGWDARRADLIVGTSAGSGVASSLRMGISPRDHLRRAQDLEPDDSMPDLDPALPRTRAALPDHPGFGPLDLLRPTAPFLFVSTFLAPGPIRPGLLSGLLPRGRVPTTFLGDRVRAGIGDGWPERPTWICTTRARDGTRVVFGRDDVDDTDLGTAVEASSAVPGYFVPVRIGPHEYVDGGAFSPTNADLVAGLGFDLVVVISPMSAVPSALGFPDLVDPRVSTRAMHARTLAREVAKVRDHGSPVLVIQPTSADLDVMGGNALDNAAAPPVARAAHRSVAALLARDVVADRVALLTDGDDARPVDANG
jgi:NTE family protein